MYVLLTDFRFVGPTDERYVTGGGGRAGVTLCDRGVKIGQKKRYVIVERPLWTAPKNLEQPNKEEAR